MPYVLIHHKVTDYDEFRSVFDDDAARRKQLGSQGGRLLRSAVGRNDFFPLFEWDDAENARKSVVAYDTHEAFEWALPLEEVQAFVLADVEEVEC